MSNWAGIAEGVAELRAHVRNLAGHEHRPFSCASSLCRPPGTFASRCFSSGYRKRLRIANITQHKLVVLKHITLNFICLDLVKRKGGVKARRLVAATPTDTAPSSAASNSPYAIALCPAHFCRSLTKVCYTSLEVLIPKISGLLL